MTPHPNPPPPIKAVTPRHIWDGWANEVAAGLRSADRWRAPRVFDSRGPVGTLADGREVVSFASNDYLGLSQHSDVIAAAHNALDRFGAGSGSARLIVGARTLHDELEHELAAWKSAERAVIFPTGFAANLGVFGALADSETLICSDELNHASIIDGCRLAKADIAIFRHRDLAHLNELLGAANGRRTIIASDSVFSMDGDIADLNGLLAVARDHGALLVLDEAHAVLGPDLRFDATDAYLRVGTMSKTLGALGGFVAGPRRFTDLLVNRARSYIFTTAPTPADTAAALAALQVVRGAEGMTLVARLHANTVAIRSDHPSPIIPVMCGSEERAIAAAAALLDAGVLVPAIRPPTVAPGTCRLRIAMSALHTDAHIAMLRNALTTLEYPC